MAFREVSVIEIREVLRLWLRGEGLRSIAQLVAPDRKTVRRYVEAAQAAGLSRDGGEEQLTDELLGVVVEAVRPARPRGRGAAWERCEAERDRIKAWLDADVPVVKIGDLLARRGVVVPERTLHRFCAEELGHGKANTTVRVADGEPGRGGPGRLRPARLPRRLGAKHHLAVAPTEWLVPKACWTRKGAGCAIPPRRCGRLV
jgi:hypothetical protein